MTTDYYLGVDPGKKGAWALLDAGGNLQAVEPLPYLGDRLDVIGLKDQWVDRIGEGGSWLSYKVAANFEMPLVVQDQSGGQKSFINLGILIAVATLCGATITMPAPHIWKGKMNLSKDKSASVRLAVDLWPSWREKFVGPRGGLLDGNAEAALLAEHRRRAELRIRTPEPKREPRVATQYEGSLREWAGVE